MKILLTGGLGDLLALESTWTDQFRSRITHFYWAVTREHLAKPLFQACRAYNHVRHVTAFDDWQKTGGNAICDAYQLSRLVPLPDDVEDWSISERFAWMYIGEVPYQCSALLTWQLANVKRFLPKQPFYVIQGDTPLNPADHAAERRMQKSDWDWICDRLTREKALGLVVNSPDARRPPIHRQLVDLTGKTTCAESLELLKNAIGYLGIDSWLSVAAAKLFDPDRIAVRCVNPWVYVNRCVYYAPHTDWHYVRPHLDPRKCDTKQLDRYMKLTGGKA